MNKLYKKVKFVGLTGQSGAGKTTVGQYLADTGYGVINCDLLSRKVTSDGSSCLDDLVAEFSSDILNEDGTLNRKALGNIVFTDNNKLIRLNDIIFPYILDKLQSVAEYLMQSGFKVIVFDAPTLFESGLDKTCDIVISVISPEEIRRERIVERDGITPDEANARIFSQLSEDYFKKQSDMVVNNNNGIETLYEQLDAVRDYIKKFKKVV